MTIAAHWVKDMQQHFQDHGFYRAEDLYRLLGDPTDCVTVQAPDYLAENLHAMGAAARHREEA